MQFASHASDQDIVDQTRYLCRIPLTDTTTYHINDITRHVNAALEEIIGMILNADGNWEWDDTNQTDLPEGLGTLVAAQQDYTFSSEYLGIKQVKVLDNDGDWSIVKPLDQFRDNFDGIAIEEYFTATGFPEYYDIIGDTIRLYPAPSATDVTLASGLKVHFQRTADLFTTSDTTQEPGIPSPYHILLCYMAALPYCINRNKDVVAWLEKQITEGKAALLKHFGNRDKDRRKIMTNNPINYI